MDPLLQSLSLRRAGTRDLLAGKGGGTKDQGKGWSWRRGGGGVATKLRKLQSWPAAAAGGRGGFSSSEYIFLI